MIRILLWKVRHSSIRCQAVRAQHVSDLEDFGTFWQVGKIDCYSLSSLIFLFFLSYLLVCSSQHPQIKLWRCGIVKQARGLKDWRGTLPLWIPVIRPGGVPSLSALAVTTVQLRWVLSVCLCVEGFWGDIMGTLTCLPTCALPSSPQLCFIRHFPKQTLFKIRLK